MDRDQGLEPRDYSKDKQRSFDKMMRDNYAMKVESSKLCFKEVFGLEAHG